MRKAVLFDGVTKSSDHVILSKNISKSTGSVFSGKNLIAHAGQFRGRGKFINDDLLVFCTILSLNAGIEVDLSVYVSYGGFAICSPKYL